MNELNKLLALTGVTTLSVGCQIIVMVHGWGLTPNNWWVIIGIGVFASTALAGLAAKVMKSQ